MTGVRSYTTKIWRQPSSIGFSSADALSTSMDPPGEPVISTQKRPCQKIQNGSEFPELVAQNFRNPQMGIAHCHFDVLVSHTGPTLVESTTYHSFRVSASGSLHQTCIVTASWQPIYP